MARKRGKFITLEGIEGCGKSTQIRYIANFLKKQKKPFILVREPGGTRISEKIRAVLLDKKNHQMDVKTELLLYCAARSQIVSEVILPNLKKGVNVICDRFYDSTVSYQGYALSLNLKFVKSLCFYATSELKPDKTFVLDLPVRTGLARAGGTDRMELRSIRYHEKVRRGFLKIAKEEPRRVKVIDARGDIASVRKALESSLKKIRFSPSK